MFVLETVVIGLGCFVYSYVRCSLGGGFVGLRLGGGGYSGRGGKVKFMRFFSCVIGGDLFLGVLGLL